MASGVASRVAIALAFGPSAFGRCLWSPVASGVASSCLWVAFNAFGFCFWPLALRYCHGPYLFGVTRATIRYQRLALVANRGTSYMEVENGENKTEK